MCLRQAVSAYNMGKLLDLFPQLLYFSPAVVCDHDLLRAKEGQK